MENSKPSDRVKCYADAPDGTQNKYLVYQSHDLDHSIDILNRLVSQGWKIRAAYHQFVSGKSVKVPTAFISGDTSNDFKARRELERKLNEYNVKAILWGLLWILRMKQMHLEGE